MTGAGSAPAGCAAPEGDDDDPMAGDDGGVWIVTGWVLGLAVYAGVVVMAAAGVTSVLPLVVIPPILIGLIGGANLIGGRDRGRSS